jgi:EAL domain-containing protein (putative c-di-GMP-specific phosphodiesterase class I)
LINQSLLPVAINALMASGLAPSRLELEITEAVLLHNTDATMAPLHRLRELGVRISMDDFGTGYSSLSYLRSFPFDKIKIDRCFVSDLSGDKAGSDAILRAVANLGLSLGMATTAEGVETQEQVDKVRAEGCTEMQGYFFSPPRPIHEIERLFLHSEERTASAA